MNLQPMICHSACLFLVMLPVGCERAASPGRDGKPAEPSKSITAVPSASGTSKADPKAPMPKSTDGQTITVAGVRMDVPAGWVKEQPSSQMRAAQYRLPGETGDVELVVYYFGKGQGGPANLNVKRWVGQFKNPNDGAAPADSESATTERNGLTVTVVKVYGTYAPPAMGPAMPAKAPRENQALYGAILEGAPLGSVFVKATGPRATLDEQTERLDRLIRSAKPAGH